MLVQKGETMAIRSTLSSMMGKYRYIIQYVHEQTGIARNTISNLYNDKATRIDFDTLDRLCSFFDAILRINFPKEKVNRNLLYTKISRDNELPFNRQ